MVCSVLANIHRGKNSRTFTFDDFMIRDIEEERERKTRSLIAWMETVAQPTKPLTSHG